MEVRISDLEALRIMVWILEVGRCLKALIKVNPCSHHNRCFKCNKWWHRWHNSNNLVKHKMQLCFNKCSKWWWWCKIWWPIKLEVNLQVLIILNSSKLTLSNYSNSNWMLNRKKLILKTICSQIYSRVRLEVSLNSRCISKIIVLLIHSVLHLDPNQIWWINNKIINSNNNSNSIRIVHRALIILSICLIDILIVF